MEFSKSGYLIILGFVAAYAAGAVILISYVLLYEDLPPGKSQSYTELVLIYLILLIITGYFIFSRGLTGNKPSEKLDSALDVWLKIFIVIAVLYFIISFGSTVATLLISGMNLNQILFLPLAIVIMAIVLYRFSYRAINPVSDEQIYGPTTGDLDLDQTFERSFDLCLQAVRNIDWNRINTADKETGTITATIHTSWTDDPSEATISLQKTDTGKTHVRIFIITTPSRHTWSERIPTGKNPLYIEKISGFLKKYEHKTDKEIAKSLYLDPVSF
jgi:hypothetical protein